MCSTPRPATQASVSEWAAGQRTAGRARRLGRRALAADTDESVEEAMTPGPSTVRPSIGVDALLERIRVRKLSSFLVTTPDGRLVSLVLREDIE